MTTDPPPRPLLDHDQQFFLCISGVSRVQWCFFWFLPFFHLRRFSTLGPFPQSLAPTECRGGRVGAARSSLVTIAAVVVPLTIPHVRSFVRQRFFVFRPPPSSLVVVPLCLCLLSSSAADNASLYFLLPSFFLSFFVAVVICSLCKVKLPPIITIVRQFGLSTLYQDTLIQPPSSVSFWSTCDNRYLQRRWRRRERENILKSCGTWKADRRCPFL